MKCMVNHVRVPIDALHLWEWVIQENNVLHLLVIHVTLKLGALLLFFNTPPCKLCCPRLPESAKTGSFFHFLEAFPIFIQESLGSWSLDGASQSQ